MCAQPVHNWDYQNSGDYDSHIFDSSHNLQDFGQIRNDDDFLTAFLAFMTKVILVCILVLMIVAMIFCMQRLARSASPMLKETAAASTETNSHSPSLIVFSE